MHSSQAICGSIGNYDSGDGRSFMLSSSKSGLSHGGLTAADGLFCICRHW